ncbi:hypothetical protein B0A49_00766 [Cryomyces minteri]|uniref:VPS9 domain-containing protein n=1 Tax=Cryomyces minteri TaxID=331657 RepID=A0A4U0XRG0_9PEZI|nr:hypothetical protein B0A49_00766 [Cryomyces minteri]
MATGSRVDAETEVKSNAAALDQDTRGNGLGAIQAAESAPVAGAQPQHAIKDLSEKSLEEQITDEAAKQDILVQRNLAEQAQQLSLADEREQMQDHNQVGALPESDPMQSSPAPSPPPKDERYLGTSPEKKNVASSQQTPDMESDENRVQRGTNVMDPANESQSEIQSIMEQFDAEIGGQETQGIMSSRPETAQPIPHPPRNSSLEPHRSHTISPPLASVHTTNSREAQFMSPIEPQNSSSAPDASPARNSVQPAGPGSPSSTRPSSSIFQPPLPEPDPEPDLPFDFHRFLEQLRHRTADPVAKFLRSFLTEFGKKQWMVHEQVKIISDFLEFITKKMAQCEVWRTVSDAEFDNAKEGMEKLVMNRLYTQTFSPAIPPPEPIPASKGKRKPLATPTGPGRRGQHQEDVERDEVLAQKVRIYGWVREEHLDIKPVGDKGRKFLVLAQQELLKIKSYRAPRDKIICVLNCCKVIFGFLRNSQSDQSADSFVPLLIYTVLHANPDHLVSNVQYILRFRNQEKLSGEAGYYMSSLMGVVQFIETLDRTNLTVSDEEFEKNVEAAVSAIAERHEAEEEEAKHTPALASVPGFSEKSTLSRPEVTPRNSMDAERASPLRRSANNANEGGSVMDDGEENAAVAGLLRTIQKPLSTIGRIFSDDRPPTQQPRSDQPALTPQPGGTPRLSPAPQIQRSRSEDGRKARRSPERLRVGGDEQQQRQPRDKLSAEDAAARQANAEAAEAQRITRAEHRDVVETLKGMFPDLDREVIDDVVRQKEGRVGLAVDACLALSG